MNSEMDTDFTKRLLSLIGNENKASFARRCGFTDGALKAYIRGAKPSVDKALAIADACGVSLRWLATGEGPMRPDTHQSTDDTEFEMITHLEIEASAGAGSLIDNEFVKGKIAFVRKWLRHVGLDPKQLNVISVRGDSMEPSLSDGDIILIDRRDTNPRSGGVYVLNLDGGLLVKRVQRLLNGDFKIISDNPRYEPETVPASQLDLVRIIGRVVWHGGLMA